MFRSTKTIIYFKKSTLKAGNVVLGKEPQIRDVIEHDWSGQNLAEVLNKVKTAFKTDTIRVLLDDDLSYVLQLEIPKGIKNERDFVAQKIVEKIPEILEKKDWDFKEIGDGQVLVFSPVKAFWQILSEAIKNAKLNLEALEPVSLAAQRNPDPMIGLALKKDLKGKDENVLNLEPLKVARESAEKLSEKSKKMEDNNQLPREERVQLSKEEQKDPSIFLKSGEEEKPPFVKKKLFIVFLIVVVLGVIVTGGILVYRKSFKKEKETQKPTSEMVSPSPSKTKEATEAATVSPSAISASEKQQVRKDLKIKVLNGIGVVGTAGKMEGLLRELGYQNIETGNADSYDYEKTVIKIKESKKAYLAILTDDLKDKYSTESVQATLDKDSQFDVIIIVGKE